MKFCQRFYAALLLGIFPLVTAFAQDTPPLAVWHDLMEARESALMNTLTAKYSVRVKRLPGKDEWIRLSVENHTMPAPGSPDVKGDAMEGDAIQIARDCRLQLSGAKVVLALVDPGEPHQELDYHTDGELSWIYFPEGKSAHIRITPMVPKTLGEQKPWPPAYLTMFPTHMVSEFCMGPTLSELLSPPAGNKIRVDAGDGGDLILEIRSPIGVPANGQDLVRKVTLGKQVGFAPTHYVAYVQKGDEVFPPDIEAQYENFIRSGAIQIPSRIRIVTGIGERIAGKMGDPLRRSDFKTFPVEELTVTVDQVNAAATLDASVFAFKLPPGTKVFDVSAAQRREWLSRAAKAISKALDNEKPSPPRGSGTCP